MSDIQVLSPLIKQHLSDILISSSILYNELVLEVESKNIIKAATLLRDEPDLKFEILIDLCGVDYLHYGLDEWSTQEATSTGFERSVSPLTECKHNPLWTRPRFAVVYHLLSISHNWRVRLKSFLPEENPIIDSVNNIWPSANWYEREAFDLFGILFKGHPDLRRLLTDYGFIGHPFRKDFPLIGEVAMRYDAYQGRVVYEPVDIEPRTLVPKTIRKESGGIKNGGV